MTCCLFGLLARSRPPERSLRSSQLAHGTDGPRPTPAAPSYPPYLHDTPLSSRLHSSGQAVRRWTSSRAPCFLLPSSTLPSPFPHPRPPLRPGCPPRRPVATHTTEDQWLHILLPHVLLLLLAANCFDALPLHPLRTGGHYIGHFYFLI
jgi:hypothetical protein